MLAERDGSLFCHRAVGRGEGYESLLVPGKSLGGSSQSLGTLRHVFLDATVSKGWRETHRGPHFIL